MIEAMRNWLMAVIAASFLIAAAQSLVPEGTMRKLAGFVGGLALLVTLIRPLMGAGAGVMELRYDDYAEEIRQRQEELQAGGADSMAALIAEKTETYILDKAAALGVSCTVEVLTEPGPEGVPVPSGAVLRGQRSEALATYMEQELGIPKERQVYHGTE